MATKLRSVNTKFWDDSYIQDLNVSEKLLFLYLITNPLTNLVGIYEISERRILFDTGLNKETFSKGLERFRKDGRVFYDMGYIFLPNFIKNNRYNANMMKGAANEFDKLPKELIKKYLGDDSKPFETIRNGGLKYEVEVEVEDEGSEMPVSVFYKNQITLCENNPEYLDFVKFLYGENILKKKLHNVLAMKHQCTYNEFVTVYNKSNSTNIDYKDIILRMNNYKDLNKKNIELASTCTNWMNMQFKKK